MLLTSDDRWPRQGDRLLHPDRDYVIAPSLGERCHRLVIGYERAADLLIENASDNPRDRANIVFPVMFNYRHYGALEEILNPIHASCSRFRLMLVGNCCIWPLRSVA